MTFFNLFHHFSLQAGGLLHLFLDTVQWTVSVHFNISTFSRFQTFVKLSPKWTFGRSPSMIWFIFISQFILHYSCIIWFISIFVTDQHPTDHKVDLFYDFKAHWIHKNKITIRYHPFFNYHLVNFIETFSPIRNPKWTLLTQLHEIAQY